MRRKLVTVVAAGALGLSGLAVSGSALADTDAPAGAAAATSAVDRIKQALSGLVEDRTITQAQADRVAATLAESGAVRDGRGGPGGRGGPEGPGGRGGFAKDLATVAEALNSTEAELRTALRSGKTLAQVAQEKNVPLDTVVSTLVTAAEQRLAEAVRQGRLTQAQADEITADLKDRITALVNGTRPEGVGRGPGGGGHGGWGAGRGHGGWGGPSGENAPGDGERTRPSPSTSPSTSTTTT